SSHPNTSAGTPMDRGTVLGKRRAWAHNHDSCQVSHSQEGSDNGGDMEKNPPMEGTPTGMLLQRSDIMTCVSSVNRTPLGASLDEPNQGQPRGVVRNECSFDDDLSLGAEGDCSLSHCVCVVCSFGGLSKEKRTNFQQRAFSMNSTGSGRSNTTVSSVSELLELYEEDPEEILYNLGFGTEEPDIASKVPSRFFSSSSNAKGIDIKVYLDAQLKRMELENPTYALTSRFRQIKVLTTVANALGVLYSQVSGVSVQQIGSEGNNEAKEPPPPRDNVALNAAKMLKKSLTRLSLQNAAEEGSQPLPAASLATVTEEPLLVKVPVETEHRGPDVLAATHFSPLHPQNRDSFEMEEVPSTEVARSNVFRLLFCLCFLLAIPPIADLQRMASQHSDSSGFAEDPPADGLASPLKVVQESSDSCDSETTVTSTTVDTASLLPLQHTVFPGLQDEDILTAALLGQPLPLYPKGLTGNNVSWTLEQATTSNTKMIIADDASPAESEPIVEPGSTADSTHSDESGPITEFIADSHPAESVAVLSSVSLCSHPVKQGTVFKEVDIEANPAGAVGVAQLRVQRNGRVWLKPQDLLGQGWRERLPLQKSHSLPTSLLSPASVVSSVHIQLRPGSTCCCSPPSFSYRYTPEEEAETAPASEEQKREQVERMSCRSVLLISRPAAAESSLGNVAKEGWYPPKQPSTHLLHFPPDLNCSASSLLNTPVEWSQQPPGELMQDWSSLSMPTLQAHGTPCSSARNRPSSAFPQQCRLHVNPSTLPHHRRPSYSNRYVANPHDTPYSSSLYSAPYSSSYCNLQSAPYSFLCNSAQSAPFLGPPVSLPSIELQQVLSEIRGSMQHLSQVSEVVLSPILQQLGVHELQSTRRALSAFRSRMAELELDLVSQQASVFQHLTPEERQEVIQLQQLRSSVRLELQELEMQLEDHLRSFHPAGLYRHPVVSSLYWGQNTNSLSSASASNAVEPVSELLREQRSLKAELSYEGGISTEPSLGSTPSSRSTSPMRPARLLASAQGPIHQTPPPKRRCCSMQPAIYRASVCLTPALPPRPVPADTSLVPGRTECLVADLQQEAAGGATADSAPLELLIKKIKENITDQVRQEIITELLAAVSPQKSVATMGKDAS
ncbi:hypothetical protein GN956_G13372, partial [Arapaima gigas]